MTRRALVADDEPDVRRVLGLVLHRAGWEVDLVTDGDEALRCCDEAHYDAVVLDQKMPGKTGMEVAASLAQREYPARIVIFSAYLNPEIEREAEDLGLLCVSKADISTLADVI